MQASRTKLTMMFVALIWGISPVVSQAQFLDEFDAGSINASIWTAFNDTGFSMTPVGGELVFDADDVSDAGDANFPTWNFDNQWDKCYLVSNATAPRELNSQPTRLTAKVTTQRTCSWYIGFMPSGADPTVDPQSLLQKSKKCSLAKYT